ncbi:MAG TPA: HAMP domain-containing sensor histidine kinase [Elusimicrobiales bacterium]|nr:HAMP domain-containing sensor histidine kinase [Elusimicrobiales bacterium]
MDKTQKEIEKSIKKLTSKIIIFDLIILIILLLIGLIFNSYYKQRIADQFSKALRNPLISGDNRYVVTELSHSVLQDFQVFSWVKNDTVVFSVPETSFPKNPFIYSKAEVPIYFDEDKKNEVGKLAFYYHRLSFVPYIFTIWLFLFFVSLFFLNREKKRIIKDYSVLMELELNKYKSELAEKLAHDIKSPLSVIESVCKDLKEDKDKAELLRKVSERIISISQDLLEKYRTEDKKDVVRQESIDFNKLNEVLSEVVSEKKILNPRINIQLEVSKFDCEFIFNKEELKRIISNLLNNSMEAKAESIKIKVFDDKDNIVISVEDNGRGMESEIVKKVGEKGFTYGKTEGNGLGIWSAKKTIEKYGGFLEIKSELRKGSIVSIKIPFKKSKVYVLIDDDPLVRKNWGITAKNKKIKLDSYSSFDEFLNKIDFYGKETEIYIDSDLADGVKGEEVSKKIYYLGFKNIYLETGYEKNKFKNLNHIKDIVSKTPPF